MWASTTARPCPRSHGGAVEIASFASRWALSGETNETSLLIFGVAVDRAETSLDRSGSSSLHVAPEIGPNGITQGHFVTRSCSEWLSTYNSTLGAASDVKFDIKIASQPPVRQNKH